MFATVIPPEAPSPVLIHTYVRCFVGVYSRVRLIKTQFGGICSKGLEVDTEVLLCRSISISVSFHDFRLFSLKKSSSLVARE
ncbi:hypothetical protein A2U01_0034367 [Trifolium medium]|uniref:Uncharacterized protein n=1 Tax=Trifolium medium TaxID=97028 RepID=A0A392PMC4_9FABA|nr:hypothetical protein [Trifolium medium]